MILFAAKRNALSSALVNHPMDLIRFFASNFTKLIADLPKNDFRHHAITADDTCGQTHSELNPEILPCTVRIFPLKFGNTYVLVMLSLT